MQRRTSIKLAAFAALFFAGCAYAFYVWSGGAVLRRVGEATFCVPRTHYLNDAGGLWVALVTKGMPKGEGFLATVSVPLELSQPRRGAGRLSDPPPKINISVVPVDTYSGLMKPPEPGQLFWEILTDPTTVHEQIPGSELFLARPVYNKHGNTEYVWAAAQERRTLKFESGDRIIAICTTGLSCQRSFRADGYDIHYFVSTQNYGAFFQFDETIERQVNLWRCNPQ